MSKTRIIGHSVVNVHDLSNRREYMNFYVFRGTEGAISFYTRNRIRKGDVIIINKQEHRVSMVVDCRSCLAEYKDSFGKDSMFYQLKITNNN